MKIYPGQVLLWKNCPKIPGLVFRFDKAMPGEYISMYHVHSKFKSVDYPNIVHLYEHNPQVLRSWPDHDVRILWIPPDEDDLLYDLTPVWPKENYQKKPLDYLK